MISKTVEARIMQFLPYSSPIPLNLQEQVLSRNFDRFLLSEGVKWWWGRQNWRF